MRRLLSSLAASTLVGSSLLAPAAVAAPRVATLLSSPLDAGGRALHAPAPSKGSHFGPDTGTVEYSSNWSGYAQNDGATTGPFTGVKAKFVVPTVEIESGTQYSSDWVGIGGWNEDTLVQDGIEADNLNGTAFYQAWTEILPAAEDPLTLTIHPGDVINASVREIATNTWKMTVKDKTTGIKASRTVSYDSSGASMEVITERPCISDGCTSVNDLANLAQTTNETYLPANLTTSAPGPTAVYKPALTPISGQTLYDVSMVNNADTAVIATPSNANTQNDGFTVQDGSTVPPPPA
jgi:peptidase A4-like protein